MNKNLGQADRIARVLAGAMFGACAFFAPFELPVRLAVFGGGAAYMLLTALTGTCLGYRMLGMSTCPRKAQ